MISTRDAHSPVHSFYFGEDGDYPPNSDAWLCSPQFMVGPSPTLRFWRKFGLPIYGTDGLYLEVYDGGRWDTLDFIGSGGALPLTGIESDWAEESYTLPYEAGQVLKLRFRFVSDWDERTGEGFYIDDIRVGSFTSIEEITSPPDRLVLHQNRPNPFNRSTTINFELPKLAEVSLKVYDVSGRLVRTLVNETRHLEPGFYSILWNGEDEHGRPLSAGVYFYQLKVASTKPQAFTRKLVLVR
jgi:hypothetical protein